MSLLDVVRDTYGPHPAAQCYHARRGVLPWPSSGQPSCSAAQRKSGRRTLVRLVALNLLLLCLVLPSSEAFAQPAKEIEVNGVRLQYVEQGTGEPVVFVHGCCSDLRVWEPVRDEIAKKYRFIAYTQRYFGTAPWKDDGREFSVETLADDLAKFIASLDAGPVHLVAW